MKRFTALAMLAAVLALASSVPAARAAPDRSVAVAAAPPVNANLRAVVAQDSVPSYRLAAMDSLEIEVTPRLSFAAKVSRSTATMFALNDIRATDGALSDRMRPSNRLHASVGLFRRT